MCNGSLSPPCLSLRFHRTECSLSQSGRCGTTGAAGTRSCAHKRVFRNCSLADRTGFHVAAPDGPWEHSDAKAGGQHAGLGGLTFLTTVRFGDQVRARLRSAGW